MTHRYKTRGTCAYEITFEIDSDRCLRNVQFYGGCNGNTKGLAALVEGMDAEEAVRRMSGITCGYKSTSCPDQLAQAIRQALR